MVAALAGNLQHAIGRTAPDDLTLEFDRSPDGAMRLRFRTIVTGHEGAEQNRYRVTSAITRYVENRIQFNGHRSALQYQE